LSNEGLGAGDSPLTTVDSDGGGGGGFGGRGGDGSELMQGGMNYTGDERYTFSFGSGGGAVTDLVSGVDVSFHVSNNSAGGGLIILSSQGTIWCDGQVYADGAAAGDSSGENMNGGGGSGGMIMLLTSDLKGNGNFSVQGGKGGVRGGGGGGGGRFELDIFGDSATYDFTGTVLCSGGEVQASTRVRSDGERYPQSGSSGVMLYPLCPEGRGNNYTSLELCEECAVNEVREGVCVSEGGEGVREGGR
jgi:hypothetical protein